MIHVISVDSSDYSSNVTINILLYGIYRFIEHTISRTKIMYFGISTTMIEGLGIWKNFSINEGYLLMKMRSFYYFCWYQIYKHNNPSTWLILQAEYQRDRVTGLSTLRYLLKSQHRLSIDGAQCTVYNVQLECNLSVTPWCQKRKNIKRKNKVNTTKNNKLF